MTRAVQWYANLPDVDGLRSKHLRAALRALPSDECVLWPGTIDRRGYGFINRKSGSQRAHRAVYEHIVGPIPDGHTLDHLCHTRDPGCAPGKACPHRRCVNPAHLEPVTAAENVRRGGGRYALCRNGHQRTEANTYRDPKTGWRACRLCRLEVDRRRNAHRRRINGTHCRHGHEYTPENTYIAPSSGHRQCRACNRAAERRRQPRRRAAA